MRLIECSLGAVEPMVMGRPYAFTRDEYGRFTARVDNDNHASILLAVEHYREVPEIPALKTAKTAKPIAPDDLEAIRIAAEEKAKTDAEEAAKAAAADAKANDSKKAETDDAAAAAAKAAEDAAAKYDIIQIKGIGPKVKEKLLAIGFDSIQLIAGLTETDIERLDEQLSLHGSITTNKWVEQAMDLLNATPAPTGE